MARPDRLFRLLQAMRVMPAPITAARLAEEMEVSLRSLYRDIDSLRVAGHQVGDQGRRARLAGLLHPQIDASQPRQRAEVAFKRLGAGVVAARHVLRVVLFQG